MAKSWTINKDKNNYWHVRESPRGRFSNKEDAIKVAKNNAIEQKTFLRIHDGKKYETIDYRNALLPDEWVGKTSSDYKIARAEFMIARTQRNEARNDLYWARALRKNDQSFVKMKTRLDEARRRLLRNRYTLREARRRFREAKKSSREK